MTADPYRRWLSEVMLQQTQVSVVVEYFERFLKAFPTLEDLSAADEDSVMRLWAGLGYYSRARNLHACARMVVQEQGGQFPRRAEDLMKLPGIGRSTAGAIASFCFGEPSPILDGNVKRVFARMLCLEQPIDSTAAQKILWAHAQKLMPREQPGVYNQALMDLGAMICTKSAPQCERCPVRAFCKAFDKGLVDRYPLPKEKRKMPLVERVMLLYRSGEEVLLVHRAQKGVWQGLWSLPEAEAMPAEAVAAGDFSHRFTHYALHARVYRIDVRNRNASDIPAGKWISLRSFEEEAIPTPIRRFLQTQR
jgi:A/G-specific adenine glycosylase